MGIVIRPSAQNINATDLRNYSGIVSAFSHCFYPGLFASLGIPDPYSAWPYNQTYWDNLFKTLTPGGFSVFVDPGPAICFGVDGGTDGQTYMVFPDCLGEDAIAHEIGHVVMIGGILGGFLPLYYHYSNRNRQVMDAKDELHRLFGKSPDRRIDSDGAQFGFVSDYAGTNADEDFAETFKYFIYYPNTLWRKVTEQDQLGVPILGYKAEYVAYIFSNLWFSEGGSVGGWLGYSID